MISLNTSELAKITYAATIDKAQDAFEATEIHPYRANIISDEDFQPSDTRKDEMPDENPESKSLLSPWCPWYWSACTNNR
jgi:hypothetical protein